MLVIGIDIDGDDPSHVAGGSPRPKTIGNDKALNLTVIHSDEGDRGWHAQVVAHLVLVISNSFNKAGLVDLHKTIEILRPVLAQGEHELDRFARTLLAAVFADAVDLEVMAGSVEAIFAADLFLQLAYLRREELHRGAAFGTDHVMMAAAVELVFVAGGAVRERNSARQPALGQKFERTVYRGEADLGVALFHQAKKLVGGKMVARVEKRAQDGIALLGVLQTHTAEMPVKNILGFAHGFARRRCVIVNSSLEHGVASRNTVFDPAGK